MHDAALTLTQFAASPSTQAMVFLSNDGSPAAPMGLHPPLSVNPSLLFTDAMMTHAGYSLEPFLPDTHQDQHAAVTLAEDNVGGFDPLQSTHPTSIADTLKLLIGFMGYDASGALEVMARLDPDNTAAHRATLQWVLDNPAQLDLPGTLIDFHLGSNIATDAIVTLPEAGDTTVHPRSPSRSRQLSSSMSTFQHDGGVSPDGFAGEADLQRGQAVWPHLNDPDGHFSPAPFFPAPGEAVQLSPVTLPLPIPQDLAQPVLPAEILHAPGEPVLPVPPIVPLPAPEDPPQLDPISAPASISEDTTQSEIFDPIRPTQRPKGERILRPRPTDDPSTKPAPRPRSQRRTNRSTSAKNGGKAGNTRARVKRAGRPRPTESPDTQGDDCDEEGTGDESDEGADELAQEVLDDEDDTESGSSDGADWISFTGKASKSNQVHFKEAEWGPSSTLWGDVKNVPVNWFIGRTVRRI